MDWANLKADEDRILTKHFTKGRGGKRINKVIVHHNAANLSIAGCYNVWQNRPASAHYQVDSHGRIGQLVWDADTAWHASNFAANQTSIGIEHADVSSNPWRISDAALESGAHLVAAICKYYNLGRPEWGRNLFGHSDFAATQCPASLAVGGSQHDAYVRRAQEWYDAMEGGKTPAAPTPTPTPTPAPAPTHAATLDVDGWLGRASVIEWQRQLGTTADGIVSGQPAANRKYLYRLTAVQWGKGGSQLVCAIQKKVGACVDGYMGPQTVRCIQRFVGAGQDGYLGPDTAKKVQQSLNAGMWK